MELRNLLLLISVLFCVESTLGQFNRCTGQQQCVQFSQCAEFRNYVNRPATSWPRSVQDEVKTRLCNVKQGGYTKIYFICCSLSNNYPTKPLPKPGTSFNKPTGLALLDMQTCGKQSSDRIAGGKNAKVFEYPWMALLHDDEGKIVCGGTLITESYVLTAAHCNRPPVASVRLGENDLSKQIDCNVYVEDQDCADPPQNIPVAKFIKHPLHSNAKRKNDIALIRLARPALINDSVKTICLPIGTMLRTPTPVEMIVTGWGYTEHGTTSNILQFAKLPLVPSTQCARIYALLNDAISLDESQFCAGGRNRMDNCAGDSGGPLQYNSRTSSFVQYGIVSFGVKTCGVENTPGVYTNVAYYIDWILQNLQ